MIKELLRINEPCILCKIRKQVWWQSGTQFVDGYLAIAVLVPTVEQFIKGRPIDILLRQSHGLVILFDNIIVFLLGHIIFRLECFLNFLHEVKLDSGLNCLLMDCWDQRSGGDLSMRGTGTGAELSRWGLGGCEEEHGGGEGQEFHRKSCLIN